MAVRSKRLTVGQLHNLNESVLKRFYDASMTALFELEPKYPLLALMWEQFYDKVRSQLQLGGQMEKREWQPLQFPMDKWTRNAVVSFYDRGTQEREIVKQIVDRQRNRPASLETIGKTCGIRMHRGKIARVNRPLRKFDMPVRIKSKRGKFFLALQQLD